MPRPIKWRRVAFMPQATYFKPAGVPMRVLQDVALAVEEVEAVRLKDLEGLEQEECAKRMRISRPTFHRVLQSARQKVADALVNGKALRIEGGNFALAGQLFPPPGPADGGRGWGGGRGGRGGGGRRWRGGAP